MGDGKGSDVVGKEVESNTLDALERSADIDKYIYIVNITCAHVYTYAGPLSSSYAVTQNTSSARHTPTHIGSVS